MGQSRHNTDMSMSENDVKVVEAPVEADENGEMPEVVEPKKAAHKRHRSKKYAAVRAQVDKTRTYDAFSAVELVKRLSYSSFPGTITADVVLREKEIGTAVDLSFPHTTGQSVRVAIASDEVLAAIEGGTIDFDILLSTPQYMPKLAKLASTLGPKGLMPNPKTGTLTENPERKKAELEAGKMTIRTERKAPLMHIVVGNTKMDSKDLVENVQTLFDTLKNRMVKATLNATMSPGVKVAVE
jgi:large subunit ribosomal protein L1